MTNDALAEQFPEWTPARIHEIVGVDERHVAASEECAPDLAVAAATKLLASGRASPADIDYVIHCTRGPDYFLPTTACVIQTASVCPGTAVRSTSISVLGLRVRPRSSEGPDRIRPGEPPVVSYSGHVQQVPQPARQDRTERTRRRRGGYTAEERRVRYRRTARRPVRVRNRWARRVEPHCSRRRQAACDSRTTRTPPCRSTTAGTSTLPTTCT